MNALLYDTTRARLCVILVKDGEVFSEVSAAENKQHTPLLLALTEKLLSLHGLTVSDIQYFSAVIGPGSFTGIRIGVATVNAYAAALGAKLVSVNSFEPLAYGKQGRVLCLIDALHGNFYGATFESGKEAEERFYERDELPQDVALIHQDASNDYIEELAAVFETKIAEGNVTDRLLPLYLRKSQAEREADDANL